MKLWVAIYRHRHGENAFPLWCEDDYVPTRRDAESLIDDFEPGETVSLDGPMDVPDSPAFRKE